MRRRRSGGSALRNPREHRVAASLQVQKRLLQRLGLAQRVVDLGQRVVGHGVRLLGELADAPPLC